MYFVTFMCLFVHNELAHVQFRVRNLTYSMHNYSPVAPSSSRVQTSFKKKKINPTHCSQKGLAALSVHTQWVECL